jgi:sugar phosphate permease
MFLKKVGIGAAVGGVLGTFAAIGSANDGKSWSESFQMIPTAMVIFIALTFWWTRNMNDEDGGESDVGQLRSDLRRAIHHQSLAQSQGNSRAAAGFRAEIAEIESQLRSRRA